MALLIAAATPEELAALAPGLLPKADKIVEMRPMLSQIKAGEAVFIATGVGPINAALALGVCLGLCHESTGSKTSINGIVYIGLAGAFDLEKTPLRSILTVKREIWPEYGLNDGARVTARAFSHPLWRKSEKEAVYEQIDLQDIGDLPNVTPKKNTDWPACSSLTVAGVSASFARRDALWNIWHADLENMEGFAAAYAAARAELPAAEIRVVSNKVGPRSRDEKDFEGALKKMNEILPSLNLL